MNDSNEKLVERISERKMKKLIKESLLKGGFGIGNWQRTKDKIASGWRVRLPFEINHRIVFLEMRQRSDHWEFTISLQPETKRKFDFDKDVYDVDGFYYTAKQEKDCPKEVTKMVKKAYRKASSKLYKGTKRNKAKKQKEKVEMQMKRKPRGNIRLKGQKVCITGTVKGMTRKELKASLEKIGAIVVGHVSKDVKYVLKGSKPGKSKIEKAKRFGIEVIPISWISRRL